MTMLQYNYETESQRLVEEHAKSLKKELGELRQNVDAVYELNRLASAAKAMLPSAEVEVLPPGVYTRAELRIRGVSCRALLPFFEYMERYGHRVEDSYDYAEFDNRDYLCALKSGAFLKVGLYMKPGSCSKTVVNVVPSRVEYGMVCES